jgi:hypothetical protein
MKRVRRLSGDAPHQLLHRRHVRGAARRRSTLSRRAAMRIPGMRSRDDSKHRRASSSKPVGARRVEQAAGRLAVSPEIFPARDTGMGSGRVVEAGGGTISEDVLPAASPRVRQLIGNGRPASRDRGSPRPAARSERVTAAEGEERPAGREASDHLQAAEDRPRSPRRQQEVGERVVAWASAPAWTTSTPGGSSGGLKTPPLEDLPVAPPREWLERHVQLEPPAHSSRARGPPVPGKRNFLDSWRLIVMTRRSSSRICWTPSSWWTSTST